jgi:hypothetical protein
MESRTVPGAPKVFMDILAELIKMPASLIRQLYDMTRGYDVILEQLVKQPTSEETVRSLKEQFRSHLPFCLFYRALVMLPSSRTMDAHVSMTMLKRSTGELQVLNYGRTGVGIYDLYGTTVRLSLHAGRRKRRSIGSHLHLPTISESETHHYGVFDEEAYTQATTIQVRPFDVMVMASRGVWRWLDDQDVLQQLSYVSMEATDVWMNVDDSKEYTDIIRDRLVAKVSERSAAAGDHGDFQLVVGLIQTH